jgi:hypothetical protein
MRWCRSSVSVPIQRLRLRPWRWQGISAEQLVDTPFILLPRDGSHAAEIFARREEDFGFGSFMTEEPNLDALGQIIVAV